MIELQTAMFDALVAHGLTVYSNLPDNVTAPYVVIGDFTKNEWDTDGATGFNVTVTVHTWSVQRSMGEINAMMQTVYNALNRADLAVSGMINLDFESDDLIRDPDGLHLHGIQRFRAHIRG